MPEKTEWSHLFYAIVVFGTEWSFMGMTGARYESGHEKGASYPTKDCAEGG